MKQLELRHIAPYLPYGLKVKTDNWVEEIGSIDKIDFVLDEIRVTLIIKRDSSKKNAVVWEPQLKHCKPILYDLSWLTKEIIHNGETFVPIERLFEKSYPANKSQTYYYDTQTNYIRCSHINTSHHKLIYIVSEVIGRNSFEDMQQLIEWRFDVFNLINDGLAIPVTEDFSPYK